MRRQKMPTTFQSLKKQRATSEARRRGEREREREREAPSKAATFFLSYKTQRGSYPRGASVGPTYICEVVQSDGRLVVLWRRRPALSFNISSSNKLQKLEQIRHQRQEKRCHDMHGPAHVGHRQSTDPVRHTHGAPLSRRSSHRGQCNGHARYVYRCGDTTSRQLCCCASSGKMDDVRAVAQKVGCSWKTFFGASWFPNTEAF